MNVRTVLEHLARRATWYVLGVSAVLVLGTYAAGLSSGADPAADTGEPDRGWGGPFAIAIAAAVAWGVHRVTQIVRDRIANPSPAPAIEASVTDISQVNRVSVSGVRRRDTQRRRQEEWIELGAGVGIIHRPAETDEADDDVDLRLDDPSDAPREVTRKQAAGPPLSLEQYVDQLDLQRVPHKDLSTAAMERYRVSQSTVDRALRNARKRRRQTA